MYLASVFLKPVNEYAPVYHVINSAINMLPLGSIWPQLQLLYQTLGVQLSHSHAQILVVH